MWYLLKQLFQLILFFIWSLILVNLIFFSIFSFLIFIICLIIFLFWFIITSIGWTIAFIPILKFVFIPWHRRQCHLWTKNEQKRRLSIAFFHPYCNNNENDNEQRILWTQIETILKKYQNDIQIIIYIGNINITPEEILYQVKERFDIDTEIYKNSITFIYLHSRFLIDGKNSEILNVLRKNIGSIIVSFEALIRFIPDIYVDTMSYPFTYPCFYYFASIPIISYINYPIISRDKFEEINEQHIIYNHHQLITDNSLLNSKLKLIFYEIFTYIYGWCLRCSKLIYCNSLWTKNHIESISKLDDIHLVYPPCNIKNFCDISSNNKDEQIIKTIISIGQFHPEQNHELQIRAFHQLLQSKPEYDQKLKLVLISSTKTNEDEEYLKKLQILIDNLNINKQVEFKLNINSKELKTQLNQAIIGLHTMPNEHFGTGIVKMMAAGVIVIAHKSGVPKMDIIDEGLTGFLACDIDSYVTKMQQILEMNIDERCQIQERARDNIERFSKLNFENLFLTLFDTILFLK